MHPYRTSFFENSKDDAVRSAREVVPLVMDLVRPRSVIDVGCALGGWLAAFREHDVTDILGVDGPYVDRQRLLIPSEQFKAHNLETPLRLDRTFDLVVSLEVAEHLPAACADAFIETLTRLGPIILFSAAIPYQFGVGHHNEQWPEYWHERFQKRGWVAVDCLRKTIWYNHRVSVWYVQNILIYCRQDALDRYPRLKAEGASDGAPLGMVHPRMYLRALAPWRVLAMYPFLMWQAARAAVRSIAGPSRPPEP